MPTPTKPSNILSMEKKSHRTKRELKQREQAEKELSSKDAFKERPETKKNPVAHKEYLRINKLFKGIQKNDALYEPIMNRYCMIQAECKELEDSREEFRDLVKELRETFYSITDNMDLEEKQILLIDFSREIARMMASVINCDKQIQSKRKMLLDIEKENIMTVASALRSIPKKQEEKSNALLEALGG